MTARRKVFAYGARRPTRSAEWLVFNCLDEAGFEVPKGGGVPVETPEADLRREPFEEAGLSAIRVAAELGSVRYRDEEPRFSQVEPGAMLPDVFSHIVTGHDADAGLAHVFRWLSRQRSARGRLVRGCGAFVARLLPRLGSE